jgi:DNA repair protein SbcD/Mre11
MAPLPDNVTIFDRRAFSRVQLSAGISLWGFGHEFPADRNPAISGFACDGPGAHLLLFHGSDKGRMPPGKESVAPFVADDIAATGAAHAMIGHFHGMLEGERYAYPGSLEPHGFSDDGRHTASIVSVEDGKVSVEFVDMDRVRYRTLDCDLSAYGDRADLQRAIEALLSETSSGSPSPICRVRLLGAAQPSLDLNVQKLQNALAGEYPGLELVEKFAAFDYDAYLRRGRTVQSEFIRAMRAQIEAAPDERRPLLERALSYGMLAFAGKEIPT